MKKILCIVFCTLMIVTVFPAMGLPLQTEEMNTLNLKLALPTPPIPAYASNPPYDGSMVSKEVPFHPDITVGSMNDIVIDMLEQINPATFLSYEENLTANGPRPTGSANCIAAAAYIYDQFESFGLSVRYAHWNNGGYSSDNVEATINGIDESSDEIYIICAHYDTVAAGPGADDDTSGTVAVLMAALIMSEYQFNHTIKFVTFSGEEQGLLGSAVYAAEAASQGWNIVGVLNADMISYAVTTNDGNNLIVFENTPSEWLYTYTFDINSEYSDYIQLTLHHGGYTWGSDHNSFWDEGYDALFYFEYTETPYYHTDGDTMEHINATYAVKNIRLILATLAELSEVGLTSNPPATPQLTGPTSGVINEEHFYRVATTDPDGDDVYYYVDWGDGTNSGWVGPYTSGLTVTISHIWSEIGVYDVKARAKDIWGARSGWSEPLVVTITDNTPPNAPVIDGPATVKPLKKYTYTITTTDLQNQDIYLDMDWGDGNGAAGLGPYKSGAETPFNHAWKIKGTYTIKVKARDTMGGETDWVTLEITVSLARNRALNNPLILGFLERFPHAFPILRYILRLQ
jgi:hypothetical protein